MALAPRVVSLSRLRALIPPRSALDRVVTSLRPGIRGAQIATWWALSPSLLPRPWWATATNLAVCQALGHAVATAVHSTLQQFPVSQVKISPQVRRFARYGINTTTTVAMLVGLSRQRQQADLMGIDRRGPGELTAGIVLGSTGYLGFLILGELVQASSVRTHRLALRLLPAWIRWLSWPIALGILSAAIVFLGDRVVLRRLLSKAAHNAAYLNQLVFPGVEQPWEPERSGSPWSYERWGAVGSQGRVVLAGGPRAKDIAQVMGLPTADVREPIRLFTGLVKGRSIDNQIHVIIAEMRRTGALRRDTIVIYTSTGTGWVTDWSAAAVEFLTAGNCVTISMQYSYLPSPLSWYKDNDAPINAARKLIDAVLNELRLIPEGTARPKVYLAGESLGAYGTAGAYGSVDQLLNIADGVMLSGTPKFSEAVQQLVESRDELSPERLPIIDNGRHIRFIAHPDQLGLGREWEFPRMIIAQHASDPVVWWDAELFIRRPDWLANPRAAHQDVFPRLRWVPFVTAWQLALDLLIAIDVPGGHGHNYHAEFIDYWQALLGESALEITPQIHNAISSWIKAASVNR